MSGTMKLGEILLRSGKVTKEQLESALQEQQKTGRKLGEILIERGVLTPTELAKILEEQTSIPSVSLEEIELDSSLSNLLPEIFVRVNKVLPFRKVNDTLEVAVVPPLNPEVIENVKLLTGYRVKPYIISDAEFDRALNKIYSIETKVDKAISSIGVKKEEASIKVISEVPVGA